jgi:hypothetical protein
MTEIDYTTKYSPFFNKKTLFFVDVDTDDKFKNLIDVSNCKLLGILLEIYINNFSLLNFSNWNKL